MSNFFEKITEKGNFSKSDKKVLDYIAKNKRKVETFTINQLALEANTSVASVQRCCQKLGYSGFKEFKFELAKNLNSSFSKEHHDEFPIRYVNDLFKAVKNNLFENKEDINLLMKALKNTQPNIIMGTYYSAVPALYLYNGLLDLGCTSAYATSVVDGEHLLNTSTNNSTIILFSINGLIDNHKNYWHTLIENKRNNSFLITMNKETKLKSYFSHTFILPGKNIANQNAIDPQSIPVIFVETILNMMYDSIYIK